MSIVNALQTIQATSSAYSDLPELAHARPLILQHPSHPHGASEESSMSWLLDFYPSVFRSVTTSYAKVATPTHTHTPLPPRIPTPPSHTHSTNSPKDKLSEAFTAEQQQQQDSQSGHHSGGSPTSDQGSLGGFSSAGTETVTAQPDYNAHTIFRSQEK